MSDVFQPLLPEVDRRGITRAPVTGGLGVAESIVNVAAAGVEVAQKVSDIGDVNTFKSTVQSLSDQAATTNRDIAQIGEELDEADITKVGDLTRRLTRLALGREQGRLTSTQASARASIEFKKLVAENPHLDTELRRVLDVSMFGVSAVGRSTGASAQADILTQAAQRREELVLNTVLQGGVTRNAAESFIQSQHDFSQMTLSNNIAMAQGTAGFNSILNGVNAAAQSAQYSILGEVNVMLRQSPESFDPKLVEASITQSFLALEQQWTNTLSSDPRIQLTPAQRTEATAIFRDTRDMLITITSSRDPKARLERINEILDAEEKNVTAEFLKGLGPQFRIMRQLGSDEQVFNTLFNVIPQALGILQKDSKKFDAFVQAAEDSGNTDMVFALNFAKANPTMTVQSWRDQLNGDPAGTAAQAEFNRKISGEVLNTSGGGEPSEDAPTVFDFLSKNSEDVINSEIPTNVSALYQPSFSSKMNQDAKLSKFVQTKIFNRMGLIIPSITQGLTERRPNLRDIGLSRELELIIDEEALANPIVTERSLFKRSIKANRIFRIVPKGLDPKLLRTTPEVHVQAAQSNPRITREIGLLNEYVAALSASGMKSSQIRTEVMKFIEISAPEEGAAVGIEAEQNIADPTRIDASNPFSFLSQATDAQLNLLKDNATDTDLLGAIESELKGRQ